MRIRHADWLEVGRLEESLNISLSEQVIAARKAAQATPSRPAKVSTGSGYILLGHLAGLTGMMGFVLVILTIVTHVTVHTQTSGMGFLVAAIGCFIFAAIGSNTAKEAPTAAQRAANATAIANATPIDTAPAAPGAVERVSVVPLRVPHAVRPMPAAWYLRGHGEDAS